MHDAVLNPPTEEATPLPPFIGLNMAQISVITDAEQAQAVLHLLLAADVLGFDTESQPTFIKGQISTGPHLIQLATDQHAYLFPFSGSAEMLPQLREVLQAPQVLKVGFGTRNDARALQKKFALQCNPLLDLARSLRENKRKGEVGAKTAVSRFFNQSMQKSKKISTSNWGRRHLSSAQILYAANDAYVALRVYRRWRELGGK